MLPHPKQSMQWHTLAGLLHQLDALSTPSQDTSEHPATDHKLFGQLRMPEGLPNARDLLSRLQQSWQMPAMGDLSLVAVLLVT